MKFTDAKRRALEVGKYCRGGWQPQSTSDWRNARELVDAGLLARPTTTRRYSTTGAGHAALQEAR